MEQNNFSYAKRKVIAIPMIGLFLMIMLSVFVSAACQLEVTSGTTSLSPGNYLYDCVYVAPGATLTLSSGGTLNITATQNITVRGTISSTGAVAGGQGNLNTAGSGGSGTGGGGGGAVGGGGFPGRNGGGGGGHGGGGGTGGGTSPGGAGSAYGSSSDLTFLTGSGGGGGAADSSGVNYGGGGGTGGGILILRTPLIDISSGGTLDVKGDPGGPSYTRTSYTGAGGGGSGGTLGIFTSNLSWGSGIVYAKGGDGGSGCTGSGCGGGSQVAGGGGGGGGRIKLFYRDSLIGSPSILNYNQGSGGGGAYGGPGGSGGSIGTYYTTNGTQFNFVPDVIGVYPANNTVYNVQKNSATRVPPYYTCSATDTPGYSDGSDLLKNVTFYLWTSAGSLVYSSTNSVSGTSNSTNFYYLLDYTNYGSYKWGCSVCDNKSECFTYPQNKTFTISQPLNYALRNLVYDYFNDTVVNPSLWAISLLCGATCNLPGYPVANVSLGSLIALANASYPGGSPSSVTATANATNFPPYIYIENLTISADLISSSADAGTTTAQLNVFGNNIIQTQCTAPFTCSPGSDTSVWLIKKNNTAGTNKFDVYNDGVWTQQITATDNLVQAYATSDAANLPNIVKYSRTTISSIDYVLNDDFLTVNLTSPNEGVTITTPNVNFTGYTNTSLNFLVNASVHIDNNAVMTLPLNGTNATLLFPVSSMSIGNHTWHINVCDNASNCKESVFRNFYNSYFITNQTTFTNPVYETDSQNYSVTVIYDTTAQPNAYAYFVYNGVTYPTLATKTTNGSYVTFTSTIDVPLGSAARTFYWKVYLDPNSPSSFQTTTNQTQTVNTLAFSICGGAGGSTKFLQFNFLNEMDGTPVNLTVQASSFYYWLGSGSVTQNYFYNTAVPNSTMGFCFTPAYKTMYVTPTIQYGLTGAFPFRTYSPIVPAYLTTSNSTTTIPLYSLSFTDSGSVTIQVLDSAAGTSISGARVIITRSIQGTQTTIFDGLTDAAGTVNIYLSTVSSYTITASKSGCGSNTQTITPITSYQMSLNCAGNITKFVSSIDGVTYQRTPKGGISVPGTIEYGYYISSTVYPIVAAKFQLFDEQGNILATNETYVNQSLSFCTNSTCSLTLTYTSVSGDQIKGRYYINLGAGSPTNNTYILLESDAFWRFININQNNSQQAALKFFTNLQQFFEVWGSGSANCAQFMRSQSQCTAEPLCKWINQTVWDKEPPDYSREETYCILKDEVNKAEFNRILFIFFGLVIVLFIMGKVVGYEMTNPGSFVAYLTGMIIILSIAGMFTYQGLTPWQFFNQYIYAFITVCFSIGYNLSIIRRYSM